MPQRAIQDEIAPKNSGGEPPHPGKNRIRLALHGRRESYIKAREHVLGRLLYQANKLGNLGVWTLPTMLAFIGHGLSPQMQRRWLREFVALKILEHCTVDGRDCIRLIFYAPRDRPDGEGKRRNAKVRADNAARAAAYRARHTRACAPPSVTRCVTNSNEESLQVTVITKEFGPSRPLLNTGANATNINTQAMAAAQAPVGAAVCDLDRAKPAHQPDVRVAYKREGSTVALSGLTRVGGSLPPGFAQPSQADIDAVDDLPLHPAADPEPAAAPPPRAKRQHIPEVDAVAVRQDYFTWAERLADRARSRPPHPLAPEPSPKACPAHAMPRPPAVKAPPPPPAKPRAKPLAQSPGLLVTRDWIEREVRTKPAHADFNPAIALRRGLGINSMRLALESVMAAKTKFRSANGALYAAAVRYQTGQWC